jgi:hypothetical protein
MKNQKLNLSVSAIAALTLLMNADCKKKADSANETIVSVVIKSNSMKNQKLRLSVFTIVVLRHLFKQLSNH